MKQFRYPNGAFFPEELEVIHQEWKTKREVAKTKFFSENPHMRSQGHACHESPFGFCVWDPSDPDQSFLDNTCVFCKQPGERK